MTEKRVKTYIVRDISFTMIKITGGTFTMGDLSGLYDDEMEEHSVTIDDYFIGETVVTQALWQAVMDNNPSEFTGDGNRPVECVSWNDCQEFIKKLNLLTGENFRLPTEAEWEYAAQGGNKSQGYKYAGSNYIDEVAWHENNSNDDTDTKSTHPVKSKIANELGLYDMSGNVNEWCYDKFANYPTETQTNPTGATEGTHRVYRGGSFCSNEPLCRIKTRHNSPPDIYYTDLGFRLAI